jgi:hypothetical protein
VAILAAEVPAVRVLAIEQRDEFSGQSAGAEGEQREQSGEGECILLIHEGGDEG